MYARRARHVAMSFSDAYSTGQCLRHSDAPADNRSFLEIDDRSHSSESLSFTLTRAIEEGPCLRIWRVRYPGPRLLSVQQRILLRSDPLRPVGRFRAEPVSQ